MSAAALDARCPDPETRAEAPLDPTVIAYNQSMQIRLATTSDVPGIMEIVRANIPLLHAAGNLQWDDRYPNPQVFEEDIALGQLWVVLIEEEVAGVIAATTEQYPEYALVGWDISDPALVVHRVAVSPHRQGKGIAASLLHQAEVIARSRKLPRILADTNSHNQAMRHLLPKLDYKFCGEITLAFRPGMRFLCYEKTLSL